MLFQSLSANLMPVQVEAISSCLNGEGIYLAVGHLKSYSGEAIKNVFAWSCISFLFLIRVLPDHRLWCLQRRISPRHYEKGFYRTEARKMIIIK